MKMTLGEIADILHAEGDFTTKTEVRGYSIDSRTVGQGELYFAVKGERLDGHVYVEAALANGAAAAVVSMRWLAPAEVDPCRLLRVPDHSANGGLRALQRLAQAVRRRWGGRVIAVTGSAGKTTTKEAIATVLATKFRVLKTEGNLNNGYGLPLQLLRLESGAEDGHQIAVVEMGMNHGGEIAALAAIAEPDWGVVTNVAPVHLEHFPEGLAGIAAAKYELIAALPPTGMAVLNADDPAVAKFGRGMNDRVILYGMAERAAVRAVHVVEAGAEGTVFTVAAGGERASVHLHLLGRHNVSNALAAIAVGLGCGVSLAECGAALGELRASDKRGEIIEWRGATLIHDSYNSNPAALDAMVDALVAVPAERHIVVAGEMLELGRTSAALHAECGRRMAQRGVHAVVGVQGAASSLVEAARGAGIEAAFGETPEEAAAWMLANVRAGDAVLLKGSRGVRLERALAVLMREG